MTLTFMPPSDKPAPALPRPTEPAPTPWRWTCSGKPTGKSLARFHIYVEDNSGRKIAAVWGRDGEREATANLMVAAPTLKKAAEYAIFALNDVPQNVKTLMAKSHLREALAMLDDDQGAT